MSECFVSAEGSASSPLVTNLVIWQKIDWVTSCNLWQKAVII